MSQICKPSHFLGVVILSLWATVALLAAPAPPAVAPEDLLRQAIKASQAGQQDRALELATKSITARPGSGQGYYVRGQIFSAMDRHDRALSDYDTALELDHDAYLVLQLRGCEHFIMGHIEQSVADFDRYLKLVPSQAPNHWQRGISLYYAGRFADGRKQFELHQTVNSNDVENAVWHFLCVARQSGIAKARENLIPITGDGRIPMMQVHALFDQKAKPEDVLAAANEGKPSPAQLEQQLFYAHLYLGLYYEALGDAKLTREYIDKAAAKSAPYGYMGAVARVHANILKAKPVTKPVPKP